MTGFRAKAGFLALALVLAAGPGLGAGGGGSGGSTGGSGGSSGASASQPSAGTPTYAEAEALVNQGQYRKALKTLRVLAKADPSNADVWNLMGYSSRKLQKFDDASIYYANALKIDPKHLGALEYQGELYIETGAYTQAKANLKTLKSLCGTCEYYADLKAALTAAGQS